MRREPVQPVSGSHRIQHSLKVVFCTLSLHPYFLVFLILFCHYSSDPFFLVRAAELLGAKRVFSQSASGSLWPPHQRAPITPPCQELGMHRAAQSCYSCYSPFPKAGLSSAFSHSPCKPFLHVRGENPALWNAALFLDAFYVTFLFPQINAIFWGFHYLDL